MHPGDLRMDPAAAQAVLQQFVALGYIQPPNENQEKAVASRRARSQIQPVARVPGLAAPRQALPLLEEMVKGSDEARFRQHLAQCHYMLGQRAEAKRILEDLIANPPKPPKPVGAGLAPPEGQEASPAAPVETGGAAVGAGSARPGDREASPVGDGRGSSG